MRGVIMNGYVQAEEIAKRWNVERVVNEGLEKGYIKPEAGQ
jgi:hypothetical protein